MKSAPLLRWLVAVGLAAVAGCGAPPADQVLSEGLAAFDDGDYDRARTLLGRAVRRLATEDSSEPGASNRLYLARTMLVRSLVRLDRPDDAVDAFLELVDAHPEPVGPEDFLLFAGELESAGEPETAARVRGMGTRRFPEEAARFGPEPPTPGGMRR
jgi:hypothetical protein